MIEYVIIIFFIYLFVINLITNIETLECQDPYRTIRNNNSKIAEKELDKIQKMNINKHILENVENMQGFIINDIECDLWPNENLFNKCAVVCTRLKSVTSFSRVLLSSELKT